LVLGWGTLWSWLADVAEVRSDRVACTAALRHDRDAEAAGDLDHCMFVSGPWVRQQRESAVEGWRCKPTDDAVYQVRIIRRDLGRTRFGDEVWALLAKTDDDETSALVSERDRRLRQERLVLIVAPEVEPTLVFHVECFGRCREKRFKLIMDLLRKSGEFPVSNEELDETATTVYEGI
jgi:hypothetical protein